MADGPALSTSFLLMSVSSKIRARVEAALKSEGISMRHLSALGHLSRDGELSYSELARRASVTPQSMQATLGKLEQRGAVGRATDPGRGRTSRLFVTDEGTRLLRIGQEAIADVDRILSAHIDPDVIGRLTPSMLALMTALDQPVGSGCETAPEIPSRAPRAQPPG